MKKNTGRCDILCWNANDFLHSHMADIDSMLHYQILIYTEAIHCGLLKTPSRASFKVTGGPGSEGHTWHMS